MGLSTGSSEHSQAIGGDAITVLQSSVIDVEPLHAEVNIAVDREVQALFAAQKG